MVAYSFRPRFVDAICIGLGLPYTFNTGLPVLLYPMPKRQTIRAIGKRRHARPGETLQLYTGMRTKQCRLIGKAVCSAVKPITISVANEWISVGGEKSVPDNVRCLDDFASLDGFGSWTEMREFWREEHPGIDLFKGVLIKWVPQAENGS